MIAFANGGSDTPVEDHSGLLDPWDFDEIGKSKYAAESNKRAICLSCRKKPSSGVHNSVSSRENCGVDSVNTRALSRASAYSSALVESHTMPPPTPYSAIWASRSMSAVRIAT